MTHVTCHVSHVIFFYKVVGLVGGGSVINGSTPSSLWTALKLASFGTLRKITFLFIYTVFFSLNGGTRLWINSAEWGTVEGILFFLPVGQLFSCSGVEVECRDMNYSTRRGDWSQNAWPSITKVGIFMIYCRFLNTFIKSWGRFVSLKYMVKKGVLLLLDLHTYLADPGKARGCSSNTVVIT